MSNMTSSINSTLSTQNLEAQAERDDMEKPQSIAIDSGPILDLPHRWDDDGTLIPESSPAPCPRCKWHGEPRYMIQRGHISLQMLDLEGNISQFGAFKCVCCEILRLLFLHLPPNIRCHTTDKLSLFVQNGYFISGWNLQGAPYRDLRQICILDDSKSSKIDHYNFTKGRIPSNGVKWAIDLLTECIHSHDECRSHTDGSYLPTRLIQIQASEEGDNPQLTLQGSRAVPRGSRYAALSYCWGEYKPVCMTTQLDATRRDDNLRSIQWDELPRTFQDAVKFTLALGIEYLWIDSICIVQGDSKDWIREAPTMNAVYKNSYVTLAALCGDDSRHGLLTSSMEALSSPVAQLRTAESIHVLYTRPPHYLDFVIQDHTIKATEHGCHYPLLSRAWTYQERIVSTRVIFFTESEMIYQCQCNVTCECGATRHYYRDKETLAGLNKSLIALTTKRISKSSQASTSSAKSQSIGLPGSKSAAHIWRHAVVKDYSRLNITESRDRLPAIGAIAEQFQGIRPDEEYLAGLWSASLLEDLMWICDSGKFKRQGLSRKENLARHNGLPTWAWGSVRSPVTYRWRVEEVHKVRFKAYCQYIENKLFGILESSRLELEGRLLACLLEWAEVKGVSQTKLSYKNETVWRKLDGFKSGHDWPKKIDIWMDCDRDGFQCLPRRQRVYLLEISSTNKPKRRTWKLLLLRLEDESQGSTSGVQAYTRGGVVGIDEEGGQEAIDSNSSPEGSSPEKSSFDKLRPDGFEALMREHSELTTCEIR